MKESFEEGAGVEIGKEHYVSSFQEASELVHSGKFGRDVRQKIGVAREAALAIEDDVKSGGALEAVRELTAEEGLQAAQAELDKIINDSDKQKFGPGYATNKINETAEIRGRMVEALKKARNCARQLQNHERQVTILRSLKSIESLHLAKDYWETEVPEMTDAIRDEHF